jgi:hypothetical protein
MWVLGADRCHAIRHDITKQAPRQPDPMQLSPSGVGNEEGPDDKGKPSLHTATAEGSLNVMLSLLDCGVDMAQFTNSVGCGTIPWRAGSCKVVNLA